MKNITSKDPRKAEAVAALKIMSGADKVTSVGEDTENFGGNCLRYDPNTGKYERLDYFTVKKSSVKILISGKFKKCDKCNERPVTIYDGYKNKDYCGECYKNLSGKTSEVKPKKEKVIKGKTAEEFIEFLEGTLIPDLKESGSTYTAQDFETSVKWIKHFKG